MGSTPGITEEFQQANNEQDDDDESDLSNDSEDNDSTSPSNSISAAVQNSRRKRSCNTEYDSPRFRTRRQHFLAGPDIPPDDNEDENLQQAMTDANALLVLPDPPQAVFTQLAQYDPGVLPLHTDRASMDAMQDPQYSSLQDLTAQLGAHQPISSAPFEVDSLATLTHDGGSNTLNATISSFTQPRADVAIPSSWAVDDQTFGISPSAGTDEFTSWLFDKNGGDLNGTTLGDAAFSNAYKPNVFGQIYPNYFSAPEIDMPFNNTLAPSLTSPHSNEHIPLIDAAQLSIWKRQKLFDIMRERFADTGSPGYHDRQLKQSLLGGFIDDENHVLSLISLRRYLDSYWNVFHDQFPILHKPSFLPDYVHNYLLLAVIVVGASLLDRSKHGVDLVDKSAHLADFIAWNLRWLVFTDPDSCPPAKLWVLQTLAILEVYEKTNATRALHERAHVHFAATLTLMRRGSALIGESRSPASGARERTANGQASGPHGRESSPLPETWWNQWIAQEATRRAALGAFLLDSMHAVMFGHSAIMVIHEIQLPLPCDDTLWSAPTSSEVGRIEFSLYSNGIRPATFLGGLKRTLSCRRVRTNPFGRIVLMAGILSVSWHMRQQELHNKSLDKDNQGVAGGWKNQIVKALDWWKREYDESLAYMHRSGIDTDKTGFTKEHVQTSESLASVLYHLGHIAVQVDMPDLCILAGAKTMLGRVITGPDRERIHTKLRAWATSSGARSAVYHSLRYIRSTLLSKTSVRRGSRSEHPQTESGVQGSSASMYAYSASAEFLLPRPWVLYYSTLVVWAYGFLLDGPCRPFPDHLQYPPRPGVQLASNPQSPSTESRREREQDAQAYLTAMSTFDTPGALENVTNGRNKVIGLISVVSQVLGGSNWELLNEARDRLRGAAEALRP